MATLGSPICLGLTDACTDLLSLALQIRATKDLGDYDQLRLKIDDLFKALETRGRHLNVEGQDLQDAKYALAAFIDEIVLNSAWPLKDRWSGKPLQLEYFNDYAAGEEFFNKLERVRGSNKRELLEVYYLCLTLGFRGKYGDVQGLEKLKTLIESIGNQLKAQGGLSDAWKPPDELPRVVQNFPVWVIAVVCAALLLGYFVTLASCLSQHTSDVIRNFE